MRCRSASGAGGSRWWGCSRAIQALRAALFADHRRDSPTGAVFSVPVGDPAAWVFGAEFVGVGVDVKVGVQEEQREASSSEAL